MTSYYKRAVSALALVAALATGSPSAAASLSRAAGRNAQFGGAVSVSGNTAVVGSPFEDTVAGVNAGAARVFVRTGTAWAHQASLLPSDGEAHDLFGSAVAIDGDTLVVGAFGQDSAGRKNSGAAYVFVRTPNGWDEQARLEAPVPEIQDGFGYSVAVSGNTVVVGAVDDDTPGGKDVGSAYVFVRSGTSWSLEEQLVVSDPEKSQLFGSAVGVAGDTVVVGAPLDPENGMEAGAAYVFVRSAGVWTEQAKLLASDGAMGDLLGSSVSISGEVVAAGAIAADTAGGADAGAVYVFVRTGTDWTEAQKIVAPDGAALDAFGVSVSVSGETLVVGSEGDDTAAGTDTGSAWALDRSPGTWTPRQKLVPPAAAAGDGFGHAVWLDGNTLLAGAHLADTAAGVDSGAAYVFVRPGTTWVRQQKLLPVP